MGKIRTIWIQYGSYYNLAFLDFQSFGYANYYAQFSDCIGRINFRKGDVSRLICHLYGEGFIESTNSPNSFSFWREKTFLVIGFVKAI